MLRKRWIVRRVAPGGLRDWVIQRCSAKRQLVFTNHVLSSNKGFCGVRYINQPDPAPPAALVVERECAVNLVGGQGKVPAGDLYRGVAVRTILGRGVK